MSHFRFYTFLGLSPSRSTSGRVPVPRLYEKLKTNKTWDSQGNLTSPTDESLSKVLKYTANGLLKEIEKPQWGITELSYQNKNLFTKTYRGHTTFIDYGSNGGTMLYGKTDIDGTTETYTYDDLGRLESVSDDCNQVVTSYSYIFSSAGQSGAYTETTVDYPVTDARSALNDLTNRTYLDGLGREIASVGLNQGPNQNEDVVAGIKYDKHGRKTISFEPFTISNNNGAKPILTNSLPHSIYEYEESPLGRLISSTAPGWYATTSSFGSNTSTDAVNLIGGTGNYASGELSKSTVTDPNGNKLISFTDKMGHKILSRRTDGDDTPTKRLDTYYLYDGKGRIEKVIPPGASVESTELVYSYEYDSRDNVLKKKVPGSEYVEFKYNTMNLLGAYQDGYLREKGEWYVHNYDSHGRPRYEGFKDGPISNGFQTISPTDILIENKYGTNTHDQDKLVSTKTRILGTDDFITSTNIYSTCGRLDMQTGNNHLNINPTIPEQNVHSYDGAGNLVESVYTHRAFNKNSTLRSVSHLDHAGRNTKNEFQLGSGQYTTVNQFIYNAKGQVSSKYQGDTYGNGPYDFLQKFDYQYLENGMLEGINIDGLSNGDTKHPTWNNATTDRIPYYKNTNPSSLDELDLFHLQLYRDVAPVSSYPHAAGPRKNGDISFVCTQVLGRRQMLWDAKYDSYDRMTDARWYELTIPFDRAHYYDTYSTSLTYDDRGNINTLEREGTYIENNRYHHDLIDVLDYDYVGDSNNPNDHSSNQLKTISESSSTSKGYVNNGDLPNYTYDENGNTIYDPSRGVNIEYNHLNLPVLISWEGTYQSFSTQIEMIYDASGTLLTRKSYSWAHQTQKRIDFVGSITYSADNSTLENQLKLTSVGHQEGRVSLDNGNQRYDYAITDHLGNTRLIYSDLDQDGLVEVPKDIIEEKNYYPFGMEMEGPWIGETSDGAADFAYNTIEKVSDFDLNVNIAFFRTLDPTTGRWWSVDPKAEAVKSHSPYVSMGNSPMLNSDPNGDLFFAIPQIGFSNGKLSVGLEVGVGVPGVLSASVTGGVGGGGTYWSVQGSAAGLYAGYGSNGAFGGIGYQYAGVSAGLSIGSGGPRFGVGYGASFGNGYAGSIGMSYGQGGFGYNVGASSLYRWGTTKGARTSDGAGSEGAQGTEERGIVGLFDEPEAYYRMYLQSRVEGVETSAWITDDGILISPIEHAGAPKNTHNGSDNTYFPISYRGKTSYAIYNGVRHRIQGQIHTHPMSDRGLSADDRASNRYLGYGSVYALTRNYILHRGYHVNGKFYQTQLSGRDLLHGRLRLIE